MEFNLSQDIGSLTNIDKKTLDKLTDIINNIIEDNVYETKLSMKNKLTIDIGIGCLNILILDTEIKYKFIPNATLENNIKKIVTKNRNPLKLKIDEKINKSIYQTYKDLI